MTASPRDMGTPMHPEDLRANAPGRRCAQKKANSRAAQHAKKQWRRYRGRHSQWEEWGLYLSGEASHRAAMEFLESTQ